MAEEQKKQEDIAAEDLATQDDIKGSDNSDENTESKANEKRKKPNKIMAFFTPLENFARDNVKDIPLIRNVDEKLGVTAKRILLVVLLLLFVLLLVMLLVSAFKPKQDSEAEQKNATQKTYQTDANNQNTNGANMQESEGTDNQGKVILPSIPEVTTKPPVVDNKNLENLIQKADMLYKTGDKQEALMLFNQIATYAKAIANYNLGVINAKSKDYQKSIEYYDKAISAGEDVALSAINAAVSAFRLGDMNKYQYYINIANTYANQISNLPPYAYSYALNQYYQGQYFEALSPLNHDTNTHFDKDSKRLAAKIYTLFNDNVQAYDNLKAVAEKQDELALGQLLARQGSLNAARAHVHNYLIQYPDDWHAKMTMQLINLKLGDFIEAARIIDEFSGEKTEKNIVNPYPIQARVSPSVFNVQIAQEGFWNRTFEHSNLLTSKILFYYAPYRVFNVNEALSIISDGVLDSKINLGNLEESHAILVRGATISNINTSIAQSLRKINENDLRGALAMIKHDVDENPNHAVLHYNAGLIYAQVGDFANAYKHFLRAYHLDMTDVQAGAFAMVTGKLVYKDISTLNVNLGQSIADSKMPSEQLSLFSRIKEWVNNPNNMGVYIPDANDKRAIALAFQSISAIHMRDTKNIVAGFERLKYYQSNDIVSNILLDLARNYGTNVKNSSLNMQYLFREDNMNLDNVFYGPNLARELYIYVGFITGNLEKEKKLLNHKLSTQTKNPNGLLQALGLLNIYQQNFEESYAIYDRLINGLKEDDSYTRYLGAVAAIGAGHKNAASLLLQLSKMDSSVNYESRFALGVLYQEAENYNAAAQHYNSIANHGFKSEFIDFTINDLKVNTPK
ncbi:tetratricopeptide repeat protein [Helicobacter trogontum]|nr:tetratricopeptide repeat protein [Helicobacter trogontum]MCI5786813.1 tetratricopeptide repeat protein [Helicobacter trogontum]MDY5184302.1 tetratricopeptide repeat protein [Helicobacter trogontum]